MYRIIQGIYLLLIVTYHSTLIRNLHAFCGLVTLCSSRPFGSWLLAHGCLLMASGSWLLAHGFLLMAACSWLLAHGFWLIVFGSWLIVSWLWLKNSFWLHFFVRPHEMVAFFPKWAKKLKIMKAFDLLCLDCYNAQLSTLSSGQRKIYSWTNSIVFRFL